MPYILRIALDLPLDKLFDYAHGGFQPNIGQRVLVPFANKQVIGVVLAKATETNVPLSKLKTIIQVFDDAAVMLPATLKLLKFCADYYQYPLGQALLSILPAKLRAPEAAELPTLTVYALSKQARALGVEVIVKRNTVQRKIFAALDTVECLDGNALKLLAATWRPAIKTMLEVGLVLATETKKASMLPDFFQPSAAPALNSDQQTALQAVLAEAEQFKVWLLYGITGSGKTEVYLQLLQALLAKPEAQALVLVPEINLTPQLEARFRARFPHLPMVMLHSQMNDTERLHGWLRAQNGDARIVIGTRLSVFTPMPHLAVIVVDEEHDASYKQQDGMRYSARDVAVMRGKMANVPVLLGSATPALETWYNAKIKRYGLLEIKQRAVSGAVLPEIRAVNVQQLPLDQALSPALLAAMQTRLERGEQSLLFINRRGYAPVLLCHVCAWVAPCTRCSSRLVVHLRDKRLRCHHCGHEQRPTRQCPQCGNADLRPAGHGTQRLEDLLVKHFPDARILRVDRDSMRKKGAVAEMSRQVQAQAVDILVGTQMLAKGHDFPHLTLVGVVDTDSALFSPDFRAAEKLFAQLMQVAGRAGRADKAGEVLIQTAFPDHALFQALQTHDYSAFAKSVLQERQMAGFPPYCFEALLRAEAQDYGLVTQFLAKALNAANRIPHQLTVYDPVRARIERLKSMERAQVLVQSESRQKLQAFLLDWVTQIRALPGANKVRWSVDVDPQEF
ncbi:MAG: primosomal protein N' [Methylophilaceae bacterium]